MEPLESQKVKKENYFKEVLKFSLIAILIVVPIRLFIAQPFIVSGASMDPTFENGQYIIVDQLSYNFEKPDRGDVIIFRYPKNPSTYFIKRIIGLPDETIEIINGEITIKNDSLPDGFTIEEPYIKEEFIDNAIATLGSSEYFVLGDNRPHSSDSRVWGPLDKKFIVGRAFIRLFPVSVAGINPGEYHI